MTDKETFAWLAEHHNLKQAHVILYRKTQPTEVYQSKFFLYPEKGQLHIGNDQTHHVVYLEYFYILWGTTSVTEVHLALQER